MKRFLPFLSGLFFLAACNTQPTAPETKTLQSATQAAPIDTAGLSQFQQWKAQNELTVANTPAPVQEQATVEPVKTVTVIRERVVERPAPVRRSAKPKPQPQPVEEPVATKPQETSTGNGNGDVAQSGGSSTDGPEPAATPAPAKKEGWSKAAKGAAIGGAGGAVLGAIISKKNPAAGAVIGGVVGGAVGYGIGKSKDKKAAQ